MLHKHSLLDFSSPLFENSCMFTCTPTLNLIEIIQSVFSSVLTLNKIANVQSWSAQGFISTCLWGACSPAGKDTNAALSDSSV